MVNDRSAAVGSDYSLANARRFGWGSLSKSLPQERLAFVEKYTVGQRILDAGCGGGGYVDHFARMGLDSVGVDKHEMFLEEARRRTLNGTYLTADISDRLPFEDKSFDTTLCLDVLEHVDDISTIRELARVTRKRIIITVPCEDERAEKYLLTYYPYLDMTHLRYYTESSVRELSATISPKSIEIFPEARVPLESMLSHEFSIKSRYPSLGRIYQAMFDFLRKRAVGTDWHVNWAAVIDLETNVRDGID